MTPETILGALCCIVMVLVVLRLLVGRRPKAIVGPDLGASMTIGSREVQEDCYDTLSTPSGLLIVLADGMGKAIWWTNCQSPGSGNLCGSVSGL